MCIYSVLFGPYEVLFICLFVLCCHDRQRCTLALRVISKHLNNEVENKRKDARMNPAAACTGVFLGHCPVTSRPVGRKMLHKMYVTRVTPGGDCWGDGGERGGLARGGR